MPSRLAGVVFSVASETDMNGNFRLSKPCPPGTPSASRDVALHRTLSLPLLVLYGLGVTIGAGIYVLIGAAALRAGPAAPWSFALAAVVMGLTGATFAEFAGRVPSSAGEAAYVRLGFGSRHLALAIGALVLAVAMISAAAIAKGAAGYLSVLLPLRATVLTAVIVVVSGAVAARGVREALSVAALMTLIEVGGLAAIIVGGVWHAPEDVMAMAGRTWALPQGITGWHGMFGAFLFAFFALIGFESIVNLAEEAHAPSRIVPWAIGLTLGLATALYVAVVIVAMALVPMDVLGASPAPLGLVFERATGLSPAMVATIAVVATGNGVIAQIILSARVLYGLARQQILPAWLGAVDARTKIPLKATVAATAVVLILSLPGRLDVLADLTSRMMLVVFFAVNAALVAVKLRGDPAPDSAVVVPLVVPMTAGLLSAGLLILSLVE